MKPHIVIFVMEVLNETEVDKFCDVYKNFDYPINSVLVSQQGSKGFEEVIK